MDKLIFLLGSLLSGINSSEFIFKLFDHPSVVGIFFICTLVLAVAALGGASALLLKDLIYDKWIQKISDLH